MLNTAPGPDEGEYHDTNDYAEDLELFDLPDLEPITPAPLGIHPPTRSPKPPPPTLSNPAQIERPQRQFPRPIGLSGHAILKHNAEEYEPTFGQLTTNLKRVKLDPSAGPNRGSATASGASQGSFYDTKKKDTSSDSDADSDEYAEEIAPFDVSNLGPMTAVSLRGPPKRFSSPRDSILNPSQLDFLRYRVTAIFGGCPQAAMSQPRQGRVVLNNTLNIFFSPSSSPWGPSQPGEDGIIFRFPQGMVQDIPTTGPNGITLFRRSGTSRWRYMGQYRAQRVAGVSLSEWSGLPIETKNAWITYANNLKVWRDEILSLRRTVLIEAREVVTEAILTTVLGLGVTIDCWRLEYIRYRQEYVDVLAGNLTVAEAEAASGELESEDLSG
ncbi:hypothetical protein DL93DRAFT_2169589 [Clavulina sp. PMI_390]|nr:hypothetical protein DL93DRAFT_2169589 [Clavulina sp. PMI_390]